MQHNKSTIGGGNTVLIKKTTYKESTNYLER